MKEVTFTELSKLLLYNEKEEKIYVPNEIFDDLKKHIDDTSSHIAFAYAYIYLTTWLYRYCKYANVVETLDQKKIKEILGYSPVYKKLDYLIKKSGVLEQIGYLEATTDYPVAWTYYDTEYDDYGMSCLSFDMHSEYKHEECYKMCLDRGKNFKVKYPVKAFHRYEEDVLDGAFYEVENTHLVPFDVFLFCMAKEDIGVIGFYVWCYFKYKCQMFEGYDVSQVTLSDEIKIKRTTLNKYLDGLKKYNMIRCVINQEFVAGLTGEGISNTYYVNEFDQFSNVAVRYKKREVISNQEYMERKENADICLDVDELFA